MRIVIRIGSALVMAAAMPLHAEPAKVPTVEQLAAPSNYSSAALSPDGKHIAMIQARGETKVIVVLRTDALTAAPTVIGSREMKIARVGFAKNDVLYVTLWQPYDSRLSDGVTKTFIYKLYLTDLEGKNWREPIVQPAAKTEIEDRLRAANSPEVLDSLPNDPDNILVVNQVGETSGDVYRVNVHSGRAERIQRSDENTAGYGTDVNGALRVRQKLDTDNGGAFSATQFRTPNGGWEQHFKSYVKLRDMTEVVGFLPDPNIAIVASNMGRDKVELYSYDIAARKRLDTVFAHKFFDADGVVQYPYTGSGNLKLGDIIAVRYNGPSEDDVQWIAPEFISLDKAIKSYFHLADSSTTLIDPATNISAVVNYPSGGKNYAIPRFNPNTHRVNFYNFTPDLKTVLFSVSGPSSPPAFYLLQNGVITTLAQTRHEIDPAAYGTTSLVYYKSRDGLMIPAFLTRPDVGLCGPGPWRSVVHPHGGPWARDGMTFDGFMWLPLMSSRCMAVLRPQYRGSDGWGRKLWVAGDAEWGQKMQDDKDDGAKWMIDNKIAIPGRIAMFGFSYGGYAAMTAAIRPNGFYKCAIAGAGVSNIKQIWAKFYTNPFFRDRQAPSVKGLNPVEHAKDIQIPIMVYQGERDQTVPVEQSEWYVAQAKKSNQKVEYHLLPDFAHGPYWTVDINRQQLQLLDDYFNKGCGGSGL